MQIFSRKAADMQFVGASRWKNAFRQSLSIRRNAWEGDLQRTVLQKRPFPSDTLWFITFLCEHSTDFPGGSRARWQQAGKTGARLTPAFTEGQLASPAMREFFPGRPQA